MMTTILEAALRSLVAAAAVGAGLHVLRVRNVLAQKVVWGMVLAAALAMPILLPAAARWTVARLVVHADPMTLLEELQARIRARGAMPPTARPAVAPVEQTLVGPVEVQPVAKPHAAKPKAEPRASALDGPTAEADLHAASVIVVPETLAPPAAETAPVVPLAQAAPASRWHMPAPATLAVLAYAVIALALLGRLLMGLVAALALRHRATPIVVDEPMLTEPLDLRVSAKVASPVTIGSTVVLPADYVEWDAEKLRIVLAHEGSHIRQGDFYLQLAAGVHAGLFWFSPLGWWLRRKLSDLAEAISDRAGLAQAPSRSAYAQVLLEFAARPRPTQLGVAMARSGKLTRRIERLLNESTFRQAYAGTRRRALIAVLLVPAALFVATAAVRVDAAQEPAPPAAPKAPAAVPTPPAAPEAAPTPEPREGMAAPAPDDTLAPPAPMAAPAPQAMPAPPAPPLPPDQMVIEDNGDQRIILDTYTTRRDRATTRANRIVVRKDDNGDSYMIVHGNGQMNVDGKAENDALQKARKMAKGDFVLYTHQGKSYLIDDPATVAQIDGALGPMHMMAFKGRMLDDQNGRMVEMQKKFAERDREFAEQQKTIILRQKEWQEKQQSLTASELKKQITELNETVAKLDARKDEKLTNEDLAKLRSEVAELQAKLSGFPMHFEFQTVEMPKIEMPKIEIDKQMVEAQKHMVEAQKRMQQESDQKMKSIIDQSMKDGKAKPIQ